MTDIQLEHLDAADTGTDTGIVLDERAPADPFPGKSDRPCWRVYDDWTTRHGRKYRPGVYYHGIKENAEAPPTLADDWISAPLHVDAITTDREDGEHGRLLRFVSATGRWKKWAMPMAMLAGDGNEARQVLLSDGLVFDLKQRARIIHYIASQQPKERLRAATVTGWHDGAFVLPDEVIGADDIWFQAAGRHAPYGTAGTLEGWQTEVAAKAAGNPAIALAICASLAGPLLESLNIDGGGVHFYGDSSTGKTTALMAAISAWGGPDFRRTWRATANGLEGAARMHTSTLLALDEIGEISPKELYESIYALGNGHGKGRATVYGEARKVARWRVYSFSTGEMTIASRMAAGGFEAKAGQSVRMLDIPVAGQHGIFDALHGHASGAGLSQAIRDAAAKHYGHAGRAFVGVLIEDRRDGLNEAEALAAIESRFGELDGQEGRAARMLAVSALAGEIAIEAGILPWEPDTAINAALVAFNLWRSGRGAAGQNAEHVAILRAVADFIDRHSDSRFSGLDDHNAPTVRDRAGWWKSDGAQRLYLFTSGGLREATKGYDLARVLTALDQAGALESESGRKTKTTRTPDGRRPKLYHVDPELLAGDQ